MHRFYIYVIIALFTVLNLYASSTSANYLNNREQLNVTDIVNYLSLKNTEDKQTSSDIENLKSYYCKIYSPLVKATAVNTTSTPPTLVDTNVPEWEINIPTNTIISLTFDRPIKSGNNKISVWNIETYEDVQITTYINGNTLYIEPFAYLEKYKRYMIDIDDAAVSDFNGLGNESIIYSFTTCGCSNCAGSPLQLTSSNVPKWAINIPPETTLSFTFDKQIKIGNANVIMYDFDTFEDIEFNVSVSGNALFINPKNNLQAYTKYMLVIRDAAVSDLNCMGNEEILYSFTTCGCELCSGEAPQLLSTNVQKWAINVPIDTTVTYTFNKTIVMGNKKMRIYNWDTFEDVELDKTISGNTLYLNPKFNFDKYQKYMISIDDVAVSGNNCMGIDEILYSFTTSGNTIEKTSDLNGDGTINILDLLLVAQKIGLAISGAEAADINSDGQVNILDLLIVKQTLSDTCCMNKTERQT
ncbi:MAG: Dockerin type I repeat protein [Pelotomaculum sp. PtaB.Bin104]|nr:MAG: Dockerin type I repeat protein [Pelotomaculum sp. PtaB.Bin104]